MLRYAKNMKHCFYRLTAPQFMRIFQVMEAAHRYLQGFNSLTYIVLMRCAVRRLLFNNQLSNSIGSYTVAGAVARVAPFNAIKPQGLCMLPEAAGRFY